MAKINHFLSEHILVTSSFSTVFIVPSRVHCIAVTSMIKNKVHVRLSVGNGCGGGVGWRI